MILEAQTKQQQGREKPSCLPSTDLANGAGHALRASLGSAALAAAVAGSAFDETNSFAGRSSFPHIRYVEISGEMA